MANALFRDSEHSRHPNRAVSRHCRVSLRESAPFRRAKGDSAPRAFTLLELLIVVAIIGILISLQLPAIQAAREVARRHQCANNLSQLILAAQNYVAAHGVLPPGTVDTAGPIHSRPVGYHMSWAAQILPFIEQPTVFEQLDFAVGAYDPKNAAMRRLPLAILRCASEWRYPTSCSYAGCHHDVEAVIDTDNNGVLFLNSSIGWDDIRDGRAQTIVYGEKLSSAFDLGWISGTRSTLRNTGTAINGTSVPGGPLAVAVDLGLIAAGPSKQPPPPGLPEGPDPRRVWEYHGTEEYAAGAMYDHEFQPPATPGGPAPSLVVGGFESRHPQGAQFAFGDGSVRYLSQDIDIVTYQHMGHRGDGMLIDGRH